jgi:phosphoenolpyruvate carboxylase
MFYVIAGEVTLERTGLQGEPVVLQRTRVGFVSEASLKAAKYHCDALAITDSNVIKVPAKELAAALDRDADFASRWISMLNAEVKRLRLHCERLSMKSLKDRVLHLINTEGVNGEYQVNTGLKSLAGELGVTHEALYRLANNPALARSIRHRFPYIDPLHHLQVELIRRFRDGKTDERVQRGIHLSINGIAAGLRNTG